MKIFLVILFLTMNVFAAEEMISTNSDTFYNSSPVSKKWGFQYMADTCISNAAFNRLGSSGLGTEDKSITTTSIAGANFNYNDQISLGIRQYWDHIFGDNIDKQDQLGWTAITLNKKIGKLNSSEEISPLFYIFIPIKGNSSLENGIKGETLQHNGMLRMDMEIDWTVNTHWTVGYFLSPRQTFIPGSQNIYDSEGNIANEITSTTTLIHYGVAYYNISDKIQPYAYLGTKNIFSTFHSFENTSNFVLPAVGTNIIFNKSILLTAELNEGSGIDLKKNEWFKSSDLNYELTLVLTY